MSRIQLTGQCAYCQRYCRHPKHGKQDISDGTVDHYIPVAKGGDGNEENLVRACRVCNQRKADMMPLDHIPTAESPELALMTLMRQQERNGMVPLVSFGSGRWEPHGALLSSLSHRFAEARGAGGKCSPFTSVELGEWAQKLRDAMEVSVKETEVSKKSRAHRVLEFASKQPRSEVTYEIIKNAVSKSAGCALSTYCKQGYFTRSYGSGVYVYRLTPVGRKRLDLYERGVTGPVHGLGEEAPNAEPKRAVISMTPGDEGVMMSDAKRIEAIEQIVKVVRADIEGSTRKQIERLEESFSGALGRVYGDISVLNTRCDDISKRLSECEGVAESARVEAKRVGGELGTLAPRVASATKAAEQASRDAAKALSFVGDADAQRQGIRSVILNRIASALEDLAGRIADAA